MNQESVIETNAMGNAWMSQQSFRHFFDSIEDLMEDIRSRSLDIVRLRLVTFDKMFFSFGRKEISKSKDCASEQKEDEGWRIKYLSLRFFRRLQIHTHRVRSSDKKSQSMYTSPDSLYRRKPEIGKVTVTVPPSFILSNIIRRTTSFHAKPSCSTRFSSLDKTERKKGFNHVFFNSLIHQLHQTNRQIQKRLSSEIYEERGKKKKRFSNMFKILSTQNYTSRIKTWLQSRYCLNLCWSIQSLPTILMTHPLNWLTLFLFMRLGEPTTITTLCVPSTSSHKPSLIPNSEALLVTAAWIMSLSYWFQLLLYPSRYFSHKVMLVNNIYSSMTTTIGSVYVLSTSAKKSGFMIIVAVPFL
jgi:hypothetical protein